MTVEYLFNYNTNTIEYSFNCSNKIIKVEILIISTLKGKYMAKKEMACDCEIIHQDKVNDAKKTMLDEESLLEMADFYKALSDSTRIKIINLLEKNELCVCDISSLINMTKSAVSHQLKYLREMNLVKTRKSGKEVWYSLADNHVKQVFDISLKHVKELDND